MEVHFTPELEAKLTESAALEGRQADELIHEALTHYFEEEGRLRAAVERGEQALARGEFLTHEEVGERLRRFL